MVINLKLTPFNLLKILQFIVSCLIGQALCFWLLALSVDSLSDTVGPQCAYPGVTLSKSTHETTHHKA